MTSDSLSSIRHLPPAQRRRSGSSNSHEKRRKSDIVSLDSQAHSTQFSPFPIILDDSVDLTETVPLAVGSDYLEGLLAKVDLGPELLSPMSGYEKSPIPNINEYSTGESHLSSADDPSSMYIPYKGPSFGEDQVLPLPSTFSRHAEGPLSYTTGSFYNASAAYEAAHSRFPVYESRKAPEITSYQPDRGPEGTQVFVFMQSAYDFNEASPLLLSLMFATTRCPSTVSPLEHRDLSYQYVLTASAPEFASLGWNSSRVPIRMQLQDESGLDAGWIDVGSFQYIDRANQSNPVSPEETRKRKPSAESAELKRAPVKRLPNQQLQSSHLETYTSSPYALGHSLEFSQATQATPIDTTYDYLVSYGRLQSHRDIRTDSGSQPRPQSQGLSSAPQSLMTAPSPQAPSWGSSHAHLSSVSKKSPGLSAAQAAIPASRVSTLSTPSNTTTPHLVRTSTIQPPPGSPAKLTTGATGAPFSPYALYPPKALLQINGDLDSMADHWTPEEWSQKRRIVQFWRSQSGTTIHTNFKPVKPDERSPNSICISCILWEERRECFVTSVDTIYLLESLIANHFGVEEKNRIRRNLEGYRPMTVSKGKPESEKFFKVIMGFPTPKPRNIEKDVKVFPWKILATALKKIVGKYSASYSSAVSALPATRSTSYATGGPSGSGIDHTLPSTRSRSGSAVSSSYSMGISAAISPISSHGQVSGPGKLSDPPGLHVAGPSLTQAYSVSSSMQGQYSSSQPISSPPSQPPGTSHAHRGSLDFPSFLETSTRVGQTGDERSSPYSRPSLYPAGSSSHDIR